MDILFDNIVFELQARGGISLLWSKLVAWCEKDQDIQAQYVEGPSASRNLFRATYAPRLRTVIPDRRLPLGVRRFLPVDGEFGSIFHSSYLRVSRSSKHKQVATVHDLIYEKFGRGLSRQVHIKQKAISLRAADAIICVSENTKRDLLEYYRFVDETDVKVIPNGVDESFHVLVPCPTQVSIGGKVIRRNEAIVFVGNRFGYKGFGTALGVVGSPAARDRGLKLVAIGGGKPDAKELKEVERLGLLDRVDFLSDVSAADLNRLLNIAYCLIYPSAYEGFGIPPLEAMRAGCPVLASNSSSIPEVVGSAGVLCAPADLCGFVDGLSRFDIQADREEYIRRGRERAEQFSWDSTCEMTVELYRSIL